MLDHSGEAVLDRSEEAVSTHSGAELDFSGVESALYVPEEEVTVYEGVVLDPVVAEALGPVVGEG